MKKIGVKLIHRQTGIEIECEDVDVPDDFRVPQIGVLLPGMALLAKMNDMGDAECGVVKPSGGNSDQKG